jgi:hypothetical protein
MSSRHPDDACILHSLIKSLGDRVRAGWAVPVACGPRHLPTSLSDDPHFDDRLTPSEIGTPAVGPGPSRLSQTLRSGARRKRRRWPDRPVPLSDRGTRRPPFPSLLDMAALGHRTLIHTITYLSVAGGVELAGGVADWPVGP